MNRPLIALALLLLAASPGAAHDAAFVTVRLTWKQGTSTHHLSIHHGSLVTAGRTVDQRPRLYEGFLDAEQTASLNALLHQDQVVALMSNPDHHAAEAEVCLQVDMADGGRLRIARGSFQTEPSLQRLVSCLLTIETSVTAQAREAARQRFRQRVRAAMSRQRESRARRRARQRIRALFRRKGRASDTNRPPRRESKARRRARQRARGLLGGVEYKSGRS